MDVADSDAIATRIDAARLWAGGFATAIVAALVGLVGVLIADVADIEPVSPDWLVGDGTGDGRDYALTAFLAALVATALLHVLLLAVPSPRRFFQWIVGLATAAAATVAFTGQGDLAEQIAASTITAAIGVAIGSLLSGVSVWSVRAAGRSTSAPTGTGIT